ncbi:MAG: CHASE2 and HATPase_c domain-containing protein [Sulfuricurvum sp.]|nr:CHASE2 and HATPase_c domain-containing protein [Sulfuricurvum sp.]
MKSAFLAAGSLVLTILFYLFWWQSPLLTYLDYKFYDRLNYLFPSHHIPSSTIIVEIDDKSLKALGQWPWPRMITADLVNKIGDAKPSAIVFDIVFSEQDRSSPTTLSAFYRDFFKMNVTISGLPEPLQDNDKILSSTMHRFNTVLPVFSDISTQSQKCLVPSIVTKQGEVNIDNIQKLSTLVCNLPIYQNNADSIGHIHASADSDGILRRLSLLMAYQNKMIPTLGMSAVSSVESNVHLFPITPFMGDIGFDIGGNKFASDEHANALLSFYPYEQYERISAYDILSGQYDPKKIEGKFVFIGGTAFGLDTWHTIADGTIRPGVYAHATMVNNLLNGDLKVQPSFYQSLNIATSLMSAIILLILMIRKRYLSVIFVFFSLILTATLIAYIIWWQNIYISIGFYVVPLFSYLFVLSLMMFFIDYRDKKIFIEDIKRTSEQKLRLKSALEESESEIEYQKMMLFQQSKLAAMGEMIDNIAHQWRQPLNMLGIIVQDVEYAYKAGKIDSFYIDTMTSESMEQILFMSQTIEDFRNFIKPDQKNFPFDLNQSIAESLQLLAVMFESNDIDIDIAYSDEPLYLFGSSSEFKQVMINLLHNARDAFIEKKINKPTIKISIFGDDTWVTVIIDDNGGGIAPDVINRIFEPYFTTKEEGKGSGIGLYMTYSIIRTKMGGNIEVINIEGGTSFTLTLPRWKGSYEMFDTLNI